MSFGVHWTVRILPLFGNLNSESYSVCCWCCSSQLHHERKGEEATLNRRSTKQVFGCCFFLFTCWTNRILVNNCALRVLCKVVVSNHMSVCVRVLMHNRVCIVVAIVSNHNSGFFCVRSIPMEMRMFLGHGECVCVRFLYSSLKRKRFLLRKTACYLFRVSTARYANKSENKISDDSGCKPYKNLCAYSFLWVSDDYFWTIFCCCCCCCCYYHFALFSSTAHR